MRSCHPSALRCPGTSPFASLCQRPLAQPSPGPAGSSGPRHTHAMLFLSTPRFSGRVLLAATRSLPASGSLWNGTAPNQGHSSLPPTATPVPHGPGCRGDPGFTRGVPAVAQGCGAPTPPPHPQRLFQHGQTSLLLRIPRATSHACRPRRPLQQVPSAPLPAVPGHQAPLHGPAPLRTPVLLRQGQQDAACFLSHPAGVLRTPATGHGWKTWAEARPRWSRAAGTGNTGASPVQPALHPPLTLREEAGKRLFLQQGVSLAIQIHTQRLPRDVQLPWIWGAGYPFPSLPRAWNKWEAR